MKKKIFSLLLVCVLFLGFQPFSESQTEPGTTLSELDKNKPKIIILKPDQPDEITYDAGTARLLATGEDTGGAWSVVELKELPGYKTPFHRHNHMDEAYYVLEGVLTAKIADKTYELPVGSYIVIPRGTPHGQGNFGKTPVKVLLTMTPSGFEQSFKDRAESFRTVKPGHPEYEKNREEIRRKYDTVKLGEWDPRK